MTTSSLQTLTLIQHQINDAKLRYHRAQTVKLCAVSKAQSAEAIRTLYQAGQTVFGENYLQEAIKKQSELQDCNIEWHFIGPIQSNKTQLLAQHFAWVQSVDRLKIAQRLSSARPTHLPDLNICLQVNVSQEQSKSGANLEDVLDLALQISALPRLKLRGLMAIPAPATDFEKQRDQFKPLATLFEALKNQHPALDTLSIGMSDDYIAAIAEGATMIRLGTALFGKRPPTKSAQRTEQGTSTSL